MDARIIEYVSQRLDGIAARIYPLAAASTEGRMPETFREFVRRRFFEIVTGTDAAMEQLEPSRRHDEYNEVRLDLLFRTFEIELRSHYPTGHA